MYVVGWFLVCSNFQFSHEHNGYFVDVVILLLSSVPFLFLFFIFHLSIVFFVVVAVVFVYFPRIVVMLIKSLDIL